MCVIVPGRDGGSPGTSPGWPPPVCSSLLVSTETSWLMVCHQECGSALTELYQLHVNLPPLLSQQNALEHRLHGQMTHRDIVRLSQLPIRKTKWFDNFEDYSALTIWSARPVVSSSSFTAKNVEHELTLTLKDFDRVIIVLIGLKTCTLLWNKNCNLK